MFYVYLLKSTLKNWVYVSQTENLDKRFGQHNKGEVKSTSGYKPFDLLFVQVLNSRSEARDLEKFLKIRWNKESLLDLV